MSDEKHEVQFSLKTLKEIGGVFLTILSIVFGVFFWTTGEFQSKENARAIQQQNEARFHDLYGAIGNIRNDVGGVAKDVNYIRGRLEPRTEK